MTSALINWSRVAFSVASSTSKNAVSLASVIAARSGTTARPVAIRSSKCPPLVDRMVCAGQQTLGLQAVGKFSDRTLGQAHPRRPVRGDDGRPVIEETQQRPFRDRHPLIRKPAGKALRHSVRSGALSIAKMIVRGRNRNHGSFVVNHGAGLERLPAQPRNPSPKREGPRRRRGPWRHHITGQSSLASATGLPFSAPSAIPAMPPSIDRPSSSPSLRSAGICTAMPMMESSA